MIANPEHEIAYKDLCALVGKHADSITAIEMLAIASNLVGKLIALQDQRTMTRDTAMEVVIRNIELGNRQAIAQVENTVGNA